MMGVTTSIEDIPPRAARPVAAPASTVDLALR
jgi:hypothetical protein